MTLTQLVKGFYSGRYDGGKHFRRGFASVLNPTIANRGQMPVSSTSLRDRLLYLNFGAYSSGCEMLYAGIKRRNVQLSL